jgi:ferredoxin
MQFRDGAFLRHGGLVLNSEKEFGMKVRIEDTCTACGLCCDICPDVFEMGDEMATVLAADVPGEYEDDVEQAADECPVEAIVVS